MKKYLFFALTASIFFSCEKEVTIPIDYTNPKLVVNCLFNTDSLWEVELSASQYIYESGIPPLVSDAQVTINDGNGNSVILASQGQGLYKSATEKPAIGQTYTLEVSHNNYENITAINSLPNTVSIQQIEWQTSSIINGETYRKIHLTLQDSPQDDFYMIRMAGTFWTEVYDTLTWQVTDSVLETYPIWFMTQSPAVENLNPYVTNPSITFKDKLFNGNQYTIDLLLEDYYFGEEKESLESIYIITSTISQEYYWYQTSYQNYMNSQGGKFFSQPVQVYTNIDKGLGVFAGYSTQIDSLEVQ